MRFNLSLVKDHPYAALGGVLVAGVVIYYMVTAGSTGDSGGYTVAGPTDAEVQASLQSSLAAMQYQAQNTAAQYQLEYLNVQQAGEYSIAALTAATSTEQQVNALNAQITLQQDQLSTQLALGQAQIAAAAQADQLAAQIQLAQQAAIVQMAEGQTAGNIAIANITAEQNKYIAGQNATTSQLISKYQSDVAIKQAEYQYLATKSTAEAMASASQTSSITNMIGSLAGIAAGFVG